MTPLGGSDLETARNGFKRDFISAWQCIDRRWYIITTRGALYRSAIGDRNIWHGTTPKQRPPEIVENAEIVKFGSTSQEIQEGWNRNKVTFEADEKNDAIRRRWEAAC